MVASPPSSTIRSGPLPSGHTNASELYTTNTLASVSPFHANTGIPTGLSNEPPRPTTTAAAAESCVEKMLQLTQRTSAPRSAERFDQNCGLNCHVEGAHDLCTSQWLGLAVTSTQSHQSLAFHLLQVEFPCVPRMRVLRLLCGCQRPGQVECSNLERNSCRRLRFPRLVFFLSTTVLIRTYSPRKQNKKVYRIADVTNKPVPLASGLGRHQSITCDRLPSCQ